jgi:hypothetical protein
MIDTDSVGALFQIVVVTICPDDHSVEVVLLTGGWLFVTVLAVVPLKLADGDSVDVEAAELPEVATPPVVTVMFTTVPAGLEAAVELTEPVPDRVEVMVLMPVWPVAVVFQGSWDPVVDTRLEVVKVALTIPELEVLAVEPDGAVSVSVWTMIVEFAVQVEVETVN